MALADRRPDRGEILRPYIDQLAGLGQHSGNPGVPSHIRVGAKRVTIDSWERDNLLESLGQVPTGGGWKALLAEGVALQTKTLGDLERFTDEADGTESLRSELQFDAALGYALMIDIQRVVDRMVAEGELDCAKKLTQFRNKLGQNIASLKDQIGQDALGRAESEGADLAGPGSLAPATPPRPVEESKPVDSEELETLLELEQALLRKHRAKQATPKPAPEPVDETPDPRTFERRSFVMPLFFTLVALAAAWTYLVGIPAMTRVTFVELTAADFRNVQGVTQILARPPSLFVTIETKHWASLDDAGRSRLIHAVGQKLEGARYTGARFTDGTGRTIAQWMQKTGIKLQPDPQPGEARSAP